jgi:hypothetical protein
MRLISRLLLFWLLALCCGPLAIAQAADPMEVMQCIPAEGPVESLQHFTITFGDMPVVVNEDSIPTLRKGGGATVAGHMRAGDDGKSVVIDFDETFTASGQYFLNLPPTSITVNGQRLLPLTLRYSIAGTMESFYEQITISPAEGVLESLQYFTISLPEYVGEVEGRATLTNNSTQKTYHADLISVGFDVLAYLSEEVTDPGQYTLTVPAGAIIIYSLDEDVHELSFNYTITGNPVGWFYDAITIDPAEGPVESLQHFTITLPTDVDGIADGSAATLTNVNTGTTFSGSLQATGKTVNVELDEAVTAAARYTLTIPAGALIVNELGEEVRELNFNYIIAEGEMPDYTINPAEGEVYLLQNFTIAYGQDVVVDEEAHPTLVNDETGQVRLCNLLEIGGNAMAYMEYPLGELGSYTLTVPAGCIMIEATGNTNSEMVFHYTIVEKETFIPTVIDDQPEGELRLYRRTGGLVREVEKETIIDADEYPYELVFEEQEGMLSIVFAPDNKVYIQHPVSWSYYYGWVEGTLSEDGKTITVPMGQYIAYTRSLEMAVQVGVFVYDDYEHTYFYDESIDELTYAINDDGSISMESTNEYVILGTMNRAFGSQFQYLDYEWLQAGDYESVYIPISDVPQTPPEGLVTETYYMTTANNDGYEWDNYSAMVKMGFDGDDAWIQGLSQYLPQAWIHGTRNGNTITFPNTQLLGSYEELLYFKCAEIDPTDGTTVQKDMVLTFDGVDTYTTFDYIYITADKDDLYYINYYQGMTLSKHPDALVDVPDEMPTEEYYYTYTTSYDGVNEIEEQIYVGIGHWGDDIYIQGLWNYLPDAWVKAHMEDGKLVLDLPQYLGKYTEEYVGSYSMFMIAFDEWTGAVLPRVTFDYDPTTGVYSNPSSAYGVGINKTGYLNIQDFYDGVLVPVNPPSSVTTLQADKAQAVEHYDLQGRRITDITSAKGIIITRNADGTVTKMLKN